MKRLIVSLLLLSAFALVATGCSNSNPAKPSSAQSDEYWQHKAQDLEQELPAPDAEKSAKKDATPTPEQKPAQDKAEKKSDAEAIQGEWKLTYLEEQGVVFPQSELSYDFADGSLITNLYGEPFIGPVQYTLDPSKDPKHIDTGGGSGKAIYKLDGDKLTICGPARGYNVENVRPTEFSAPKDSGRALMKLERIKE